MGRHNKVVYEYLKSHNLCVSCGRKTNWDKVRCASCSERYNRNARVKAEEQRKIRLHKICYRCGSIISQTDKLCDKCYGEVVIPEYLRGKANAEQRGLSRLH